MKPFNLAVNEYLYDYESGIAVLRNPRSPEEALVTAKRLCELSREIYWALGDVSAYTRPYIRKIASLFQQTVALQDARQELPADVTWYRDNIQSRLDAMETDAPAPRTPTLANTH